MENKLDGEFGKLSDLNDKLGTKDDLRSWIS